MSDFKQSQLTLTYDSKTYIDDHTSMGIVLKSPGKEYTFKELKRGFYPQEFLDIVAHKYTIDIPREVITGKPIPMIDIVNYILEHSGKEIELIRDEKRIRNK